MTQVPSQPQGIPPAPSVGTPASQPTPQAAAIPGAPIGVQPQAPQQAPTPPDDLEKLRHDHQVMQEQVRRLQGTQAAKDRQLYEMQMRGQQEKAALQAELQRQQMAQLPEEQQKELTVQALQQQLAQEQQARVELEWSRYLQSVAMDLSGSKGVPYDVLIDAAKQAQRPDEAYHFMNQAALNYLYQKVQGIQQQPAPRPQQAYAPQGYAPQYQQQNPAVAPPHPTQYAAGGVPSTTDEDIRALQQKTKETGKSTVEEAMALMRKKWAEERAQ